MCELIYYHAIIIFCICLVQNCLSQVNISETVCKSVWVLKLSVLKRTVKRTFIHPCGLNVTEKEQNRKKNDWAWSILEVGVASPTHTFPFSSQPGFWGPIFGSGCLSVSQRVCWDQTDVTDEDSNSNRAHNLFHDNCKLIVLAINCNHSASKNKIKSKLYHL